jgi:hypothetical protein
MAQQQQQLKYRVHGVSSGTQRTKVVFEGAEVEAEVPSLSIELSWDSKDNRDHGSLALNFVGADIVWAKETFRQDEEISITFERDVPAAESR